MDNIGIRITEPLYQAAQSGSLNDFAIMKSKYILVGHLFLLVPSRVPPFNARKLGIPLRWFKSDLIVKTR